MSRFRSAGGHFGHTRVHVNRRGEVRSGHLLCILQECHVPVVLARVADQYELISPCFVLGVMDGEAANFVKRGERRLQVFNIC